MSVSGPTRIPPVPGIAGLLSIVVIALVFVAPAPAQPGPADVLVPDPTLLPVAPEAAASATLPATGEPATPIPLATELPPTPDPASPAPTLGPPTASGPTTRVATRVAVPALGIDLPVMKQVTSYPPCRVAMYLTNLRQPGQGGVTYLYAHAQAGMFLPLLRASQVNDGRAMVGLEVLVYTGDSQLFTFRISEVRRHVTSLSAALRWRGESAWLQTSEGRGIPQKLQVVAPFVAVRDTDFASAHPLPRPVTC